MGNDAPARRSSPLGAAAERVWRGVLLFLEVIGLRKEQRGIEEAQLARFRLHHTAFRTLLAANDSFLAIIADLEERGRRNDPFDAAFVRRRAVRALADVHRMVESLDEISGHRYPGLRPAFERIASGLTATVQEAAPAEPERLVLDLSETSATHADLVGGKMANLGAVRETVGLPTPDGFSVTTAGFHLFAEAAGDPAGFHATPLPAALEEAILGAYDRLAARNGSPPAVAVRSSALGEDGSRSFAGQFLTILNVSRDGLAEAYRRVVASLHSPEAASYRRLHGIPDEFAAMPVGVVTFVDAIVSGVAFSRDPLGGEDDVLIQAVHGPGASLAEGAAFAETMRVSRTGSPPDVRRTEPRQASSVPSDPSLRDAEAREVARWALLLESHFGSPQDIEWALDAGRRLFVLQSRPLRLSPAAARTRPAARGFPLLVQGGETACGGAASGVAVRMDEGDDLETFPDGGVLVARRSSPRFIRLMSKVRAIVTDAGSVTGHMATLAREFRVPALLGTASATRDIPAGTRVTVDADAGFVYLGDVPGLAAARADSVGAGLAEGPPRPAAALLSRVAAQVAPLNLHDIRSLEFTPEGCRTLHDLARFIHEKSYAEMFRMGEELGDVRASSWSLDVFLPIDLYIIDLGGGISPPARGLKVKPGHVTSRPLAALISGMLDPRLPRFGPRSIDAGGLVSVMVRHAMTDPESDQTFRDPCYAIVSDTYLNYTARVGYHFGVVDTYCSPSPNRNYISFRFKGGAADRMRRGRRARSIAGVLRENGFSVEVTGDQVAARLGKATGDEVSRKLEMLGRLLQFFRQTDASMASEETVERFRDAFLAGDFRLEGREPGPA